MNKRRSLALLVATAFVLIILTLRFSPPTSAQPQTTDLSQIETAFNAVQTAEHAGANVTNLDGMLNQALALEAEGTAIQTSNPSMAQQQFSQAEKIATQVTIDAKVAEGTGQAATVKGELFLAGELGVIGVVCVLVYFYFPRVYWRVWARVNSDSEVSPT